MLTVSDYAAWWGAIVASLALTWNIIESLRSGPRLTINASPNMQLMPPPPDEEGKEYIFVTVVNRGTAPTTITHFSGYYAKNRLLAFFGKKQHFVVNHYPDRGNPVPYVLPPGEQWTNLADQDAMIEMMSSGVLYIGIFHNHRKKPLYARVKLEAL